MKPKDINPYDLSEVGKLRKQLKLRIKMPKDPKKINPYDTSASIGRNSEYSSTIYV